MIEAIATRRVRFADKLYAKGERVSMPLQQFNDFEPTGLFERPPAEKADGKAPATRPTKPKSSDPAD